MPIAKWQWRRLTMQQVRPYWEHQRVISNSKQYIAPGDCKVVGRYSKVAGRLGILVVIGPVRIGGTHSRVIGLPSVGNNGTRLQGVVALLQLAACKYW